MKLLAIDRVRCIEVTSVNELAEARTSYTTHAIPGLYARWDNRAVDQVWVKAKSGGYDAVSFSRDPGCLAIQFAQAIGAILYDDDEAYQQAIADAVAEVPRHRCGACREIFPEGALEYGRGGFICNACSFERDLSGRIGHAQHT